MAFTQILKVEIRRTHNSIPFPGTERVNSPRGSPLPQYETEKQPSVERVNKSPYSCCLKAQSANAAKTKQMKVSLTGCILQYMYMKKKKGLFLT